MESKAIKNLLKDLLKLITACSLLTGCAQIATQMAVEGGARFIGEQYLISQNKPITRCNMFNVVKGYKMCRIHRHYRRT